MLGQRFPISDRLSKRLEHDLLTSPPSNGTPRVPEELGGTLTFEQLSICVHIGNFIVLISDLQALNIRDAST